MAEQQTTAAVQQHLDELAAGAPAGSVAHALLERTSERLRILCGSMLRREYPRLTRPPLNLQTDEMLSGVVERLLRALREVRPKDTRQFFALANRHMRWELNDLARRLDERTAALGAQADFVPSAATSGSPLSSRARQMLEAIEELPADEREVFELVRLQGMTHPEVAALMGVSTKTVQRKLIQGRMLLSERLAALRPPGAQETP